MGLLDIFSRLTGNSTVSSVNNIVNNVQSTASTIQSATSAVASSGLTNKSKIISFPTLPTNLAELQAMPQAQLRDEFEVAALTIAVLCNYERDPNATFEMLNYLQGPRPLNPMDMQFYADRLRGKQYKTFAFMEGTSPQNNYTPSVPYSIRVSSNPYSYQNQDYATLYVKSSGADNPAPITLRRKPSTGQWFAWQITCLTDVRVPISQNSWA